jgi:AcrR family transcriptional regulator
MSPRNPFEARLVRSRRGGRTKAPLSRDVIVAAALDLLTRRGPEGMSLRQVAAALDTGPATLYAYVEVLQALQALVLDRALAGVATTGPRGLDWRRRLLALLESYFTVLSRVPGLAQLALRTAAAGPHALRVVEALLGLLDEAGVDHPTAACAVDLILLYVTAIAAEHGERRDHADPLAPIAKALGAVSAEAYPRVHALREQLLSGDGPARFAWSIEVLLTGVLRTPRAAAGPPRPPRKPPRGR